MTDYVSIVRNADIFTKSYKSNISESQKSAFLKYRHMVYRMFFRSSKSFLKLGTEFQSHNYGAMVSHTTIVFTRYIILEWIRRNQNDQKTYGELFFMFCDDIQDMDLTSSLQSLMALFVEHILTLSADITSIIKCKVSEWIASQAAFIQALFRDISWES